MDLQKIYRYAPIVLAALTAASAISVVYTHQLPTSETETNTLYTYLHKGEFDYEAKLVPNVIYNKTVLRPGNGTIFTAILETITLSFNYTFASYPRSENTSTYQRVAFTLQSPEKWNRTLSDGEAKDLLQLDRSSTYTVVINSTRLREFVDAIDKETGMRTQNYNLLISSTVHTIAHTPAGTIDDVFSPSLKVSFTAGGDRGNYVEMTELTKTKPGEMTRTVTATLQWIIDQRNASYAATLISSPALAVSMFLYVTHKPEPPPSKKLEKLVSPHRELITETTHEPPETRITIDMETLGDLARTADLLARPIMHWQRGDEHTFYVIDDDKKYRYRTGADHLEGHKKE